MTRNQVCRVARLVDEIDVAPPIRKTSLINVRMKIDVTADIAAKLVEAVPPRIKLPVIAEMPFAHECRAMASRLEQFGKRDLRRLQPMVIALAARRIGEHDLVHSAPLLIAPGEQGGARRRTYRAV